jgi:hypothetical protein
MVCLLLQIKVETRPWTIELPSRKLEVELTVISRCAGSELTAPTGPVCSWPSSLTLVLTIRCSR